MDCGKYIERIPELADGRLTGDPAADLQNHLKVCAACREEARLHKATWDLLGAYPSIEVSDTFFLRLKARLRRSPWILRIATPLVGAAAAVVFALVLFTHPHRPDRTTNPPVPAQEKITEEEKELVDNLDLLENYELVNTLEVVSEGKTSPHAHDVLFNENGERK